MSLTLVDLHDRGRRREVHLGEVLTDEIEPQEIEPKRIEVGGHHERHASIWRAVGSSASAEAPWWRFARRDPDPGTRNTEPSTRSLMVRILRSPESSMASQVGLNDHVGPPLLPELTELVLASRAREERDPRFRNRCFSACPRTSPSRPRTAVTISSKLEQTKVGRCVVLDSGMITVLFRQRVGGRWAVDLHDMVRCLFEVAAVPDEQVIDGWILALEDDSVIVDCVHP